jgi:hypothetical protein
MCMMMDHTTPSVPLNPHVVCQDHGEIRDRERVARRPRRKGSFAGTNLCCGVLAIGIRDKEC